MNKKLELQLRAEYAKYQAKAHLEDRMSFIDYAQEIHSFQGYKVAVKISWDLDYIITFTK